MMFFLVIFFCQFGSIFCVYANGYSSIDYALYFRERAVTDYSNIWGMPSMTEFTVCFWMNSTDPGLAIPFSYAIAGNSAELRLDYDLPNIWLWVCGSRVQRSMTLNDGNWHHFCASWENTAGAWKIYKDGSLDHSGAGLRTGYTVQGGGSLMLGQRQRLPGESPFESQSFKGMLTNFNVWNRVLTSSEIEHLAIYHCLDGEGNVYKWVDFIYGIKGNAAVVIPSPCSPLHVGMSAL